MEKKVNKVMSEHCLDCKALNCFGCPVEAEIEEMLVTAGFRQVSFCPLFFGAAGIHVAVK